MARARRRLVQSPGYHLRPKYDLIHLRARRENARKRHVDFGLSLTAMIDMFSTLVVFLLLNFSATGEAYFVSKNVIIPAAVNARPLETAPLISITKESVILDSHVVGANPVNLTEADLQMPQLVEGLRRLKELQQNLKDAGVPQKPQINIQADENTPVSRIKRVMTILIQEGFSGINFAVREVNPEDV
ncbi:MAG: ExbD/TolR family protein [Bdellovibrionales bacterium]